MGLRLDRRKGLRGGVDRTLLRRGGTVITLRKLRPTKVRNAVRRRVFEYRMARITLYPLAGLIDLGSAPGGWTVPSALIEPFWICYCVGAGGDISFDLELIRRYDVRVRAFDAVADFVALAAEQAGREPRFTVRHAAVATQDGPVHMQVTHQPGGRSLSSAGLYETRTYVEQPGRTVRSLMIDQGDDHIDLLKLDIEGAEYQVVPDLDLRAMGVKVFATQLHHNGSVRDARALVARLRKQGYEPVACRPAIKLTFVHKTILERGDGTARDVPAMSGADTPEAIRAHDLRVRGSKRSTI